MNHNTLFVIIMTILVTYFQPTATLKFCFLLSIVKINLKIMQGCKNFCSQMTQNSIKAFVRENFDKDYFPVYHGQTNIISPLALIVKRKRSLQKRPFGKGEMVIVGGLQRYITEEKEKHFHNYCQSKLKKEDRNLEKTETSDVSRSELSFFQ